MSDYSIWKTVAIRLNLLLALGRVHDKTEDPDDRPTRVVGRLVEAHVRERAKSLGIDLSDILEKEV